ncbi:hypothetical protein Rs2_28765 [Raphanus sativus]|nr:hypothetical protein Rs2_28765 [Raphanus sativus]
MGGIRMKELVTIGDLHTTYLSNSNAQLGLFASSNRMAGLVSLAPFANVASSLRCSMCFTQCNWCIQVPCKMAKTVQRLWFVVFDTEMSELTKTEATTLALEEKHEAEKAPGGDVHTEQAPSSARDTGGPSGKAKQVDDANLPILAEKEKSRKRSRH